MANTKYKQMLNGQLAKILVGLRSISKCQIESNSVSFPLQPLQNVDEIVGKET